MRATQLPFDCLDVSESLGRVKAILDAPDGAFEERDTIPPIESLTFENGFYVNCAALFIDIRGSSKLPELHNRPTLAKIYRAYISECVAVMNADANCSEVFINGDCVSAILQANLKSHVDTAFETAARLNSLVMILNWQLEKKGYTQIQCGIGLAWGRALMLKAGFKGSAINDLVWMGDVVNDASNLCGRGGKGGNAVVQVSDVVYNNLNEKYRGFLKPRYDLELTCFRYEGDVVNVGMDAWLSKQRESERLGQQSNALLQGGFGAIFQQPSLGLLGLGALPPVKPENTLLSLADLLKSTKR